MKIGVVGTGFVGSSAAYALVMRGVGREIVLVDKNAKRADAEADDIFHAVPFAHPMEIYAGDYDALAGCRVVIMAAGVNQKPGESRMELLTRNAAVFSEVIPQIIMHAPDSVIVVATNPVDVMTHYTAQIAQKYDWHTGRIFGSGTTLDTARFRALLGRLIGIDSTHIHAYVVGEHGDSEVLAWSMVSVGGIPLEELIAERRTTLDQAKRDEIDQQVRRAAYHIIEGKGATYYGIGSALSRIVDVILHDQRAILTVCAPEQDVYGVQDVTVALPRLVSGEGVVERLPLPMNDEETEKLRRSASVVRAAIESMTDAGIVSA
jgi:L-lactate dehydrogenase